MCQSSLGHFILGIQEVISLFLEESVPSFWLSKQEQFQVQNKGESQGGFILSITH